MLLEEADKIYRLYKAGNPIEQIMVNCKLKYKYVIDAINKFEYYSHNHKTTESMARIEIQARRIEHFFNLRKEGMSNTEIAKKYGITRARVGQILRDHPQYTNPWFRNKIRTRARRRNK